MNFHFFYLKKIGVLCENEVLHKIRIVDKKSNQKLQKCFNKDLDFSINFTPKNGYC